MKKYFLVFVLFVSLAQAQGMLSQGHLEFIMQRLAEKFLVSHPLVNESVQIAHIYNFTDEQKLDLHKAIAVFTESSHLKLAPKSKYQLIFVLKKDIGAVYLERAVRVEDWIYKAQILLFDTQKKEPLWEETFTYLFRGRLEGEIGDK